MVRWPIMTSTSWTAAKMKYYFKSHNAKTQIWSKCWWRVLGSITRDWQKTTGRYANLCLNNAKYKYWLPLRLWLGVSIFQHNKLLSKVRSSITLNWRGKSTWTWQTFYRWLEELGDLNMKNQQKLWFWPMQIRKVLSKGFCKNVFQLKVSCWNNYQFIWMLRFNQVV